MVKINSQSLLSKTKSTYQLIMPKFIRLSVLILVKSEQDCSNSGKRSKSCLSIDRLWITTECQSKKWRPKITERRNNRMSADDEIGQRQDETETKRDFDMWLIDISALRCGLQLADEGLCRAPFIDQHTESGMGPCDNPRLHFAETHKYIYTHTKQIATDCISLLRRKARKSNYRVSPEPSCLGF